MKVVLSLGHWGKTHNLVDRGAVFECKSLMPLGNHTKYVEAHMNLMYIAYIAVVLEENGYWVYPQTHGTYSERQTWANMILADIFFALHLNSAPEPGNYGLILYDQRGKKNEEYAGILAMEFAQILDWPFHVEPAQRWGRGFNNIRHTKMPAFILEPAFINNRRHMDKLRPDVYADIMLSALNKIKEVRV